MFYLTYSETLLSNNFFDFFLDFFIQKAKQNSHEEALEWDEEQVNFVANILQILIIDNKGKYNVLCAHQWNKGQRTAGQAQVIRFARARRINAQFWDYHIHQNNVNQKV